MALKVKNGFKRYGNDKFVLNNLNVNVDRGEIYGLLGASGCGKTTLLSCVVGLRKLDAGEIIVLGQDAYGQLGGLCGYMPQEISLLNSLSIFESLEYFGMLYGMSSTMRQSQIKFLSTFLDLPPLNSCIQDLSGGQKRRVSLATAMIHNPPLLVLDEPTVGLDPLLRQRIWEHLVQISRDCGTTIILSTHYIEETRRCDKVGFMRGGQLLAEASPKSLLSQFNCDSLESVALQLCREDKHILDYNENNYTSEFNEAVQIKSYRKVSISMQIHPNQITPVVETHHHKIIWALLMKFWYRHLRDWRCLTAEFVLPIMIILVMQNVIGLPPRNLKIGVLTPNSDEYCINNSTLTECFANIGICNFLQKFDDSKVEWIPINSYENGIQSIRLGNTIGLLQFPVDFSTHFKNRMVYRNFASNETIQGSTISLVMDESNVIIASWMKLTVVKKYLEFISSIASACNLNPAIVAEPLKFNAIYGSMEIWKVISYMQPGITILTVFMLANSIAILWVEDREKGLEDRDYVAGVKLWHRMVCYFATESIIGFIHLVIFFSLLTGVYGMEIRGSWYLAVGLVMMTAICGFTMGWMFAMLKDNVLETIILILFMSITQASCSGGMWPMEMANPIYRHLAKLLPATIIIESFQSICIRGWGLSHSSVLNGFLTASVYIAISISVCFLAERRRRR